MKKISVKKLIGVILSVIATTVIIWTFWANTALELNTYKVYNPSLPKSFNGFKIAQISDLHNAEIRGIFAPNQGFFPQYDGGSYSKNNSTMIVSRGIGNSLFPLRFNNRPEVVLIELIREKN